MRSLIDSIFWCIVVVAVGTYCIATIVTRTTSKSELLPTRMDIQQELVDRGYKLTVDGVWGPETNAAMELYEIDSYGARLKQ